ncbi:MAG: acyl transferase [Bacteroidia bacterium]
MALSEQQFFQNIFGSNIQNFEHLALQVFHHQIITNSIYSNYCTNIKCNWQQIKSLQQIPFLPIGFFKTHQIICSNIKEQIVFSSSSTTGKGESKHYVSNLNFYYTSFLNHFEKVFGSTENYTILGLLPGYLERKNSSLVYMVNSLMQKSNKPLNGFYLKNFKELYDAICLLEQNNSLYILFGVTHALLDFSEEFKPKINIGKIIETGGMKGRKREMIREELYNILKQNFGLNQIYSEYGMTELLSQAYSFHNGKYQCAPWMKVFITDINDPFTFLPEGKNGIINVIDLANLNSCSFIQTEDIGKLNPDGTFEVLGRIDNSDMRGCSLMAL